MIRFTLYETPISKGRGQTPPGGGRPYTPAKTRKYEKRVEDACRDHMRRHGLVAFAEAVDVTLTFRLVPPASWSRKKRQRFLNEEESIIGANDVDNMAKAILDGMNKVAFTDDRLISRLLLERVASETAGVDVLVEKWRGRRDSSDVDRSGVRGGSG